MKKLYIVLVLLSPLHAMKLTQNEATLLSTIDVALVPIYELMMQQRIYTMLQELLVAKQQNTAYQYLAATLPNYTTIKGRYDALGESGIQSVRWVKDNKKRIGAALLAIILMCSNIRLAWCRYILWQRSLWSSWQPAKEDEKILVLVEALVRHYKRQYPNADFEDIVAHFLQDSQRELIALHSYKKAAYYPITVTGTLQEFLYRLRDGFVGLCGNGIMAQRFFGVLFEYIFRPEYLIWGDASLVRDIDERYQHLRSLEDTFFSFLAEHYVTQSPRGLIQE
jgi:hypothetical protein